VYWYDKQYAKNKPKYKSEINDKQISIPEITIALNNIKPATGIQIAKNRVCLNQWSER